MRYLPTGLCFLFMAFAACAEQTAAKRDSVVEKSTVPGDVTYAVIDSSILPRLKRSLDVRLNKKVSEDVLRAIALELRAADPRTYERTFIVYYLPGMTPNTGAWATTHFDPNLRVEILGLTLAQDSTLTTPPPSSDRQVIGTWRNEFIPAAVITIYRKNRKIYMEKLFSDGSALSYEMVEKRSTLGRRFQKVDPSAAGDYWIIDSNGDLQSRDEDGLIATAPKAR